MCSPLSDSSSSGADTASEPLVLGSVPAHDGNTLTAPGVTAMLAAHKPEEVKAGAGVAPSGTAAGAGAGAGAASPSTPAAKERPRVTFAEPDDGKDKDERSPLVPAKTAAGTAGSAGSAGAGAAGAMGSPRGSAKDSPRELKLPGGGDRLVDEEG